MVDAVPAQSVNRVWRRLLITHAVLVVTLTTLFSVAVLATPPEDGATIGAGLIALPLLPLGLPWAWPAISDPYQFDGLSPFLWSLVTFGPAWLNVLLHVAVFLVAGRSRRR
jgi:hypothetical protein